MRLFTSLILLLISSGVFSQIPLINQGYSNYATPSGGKDEIIHIFSREVNLPEDVLDKSLDKEVIVAFNVTEEGKVKDLRPKVSGGEQLDSEAMRVVNIIQWKPAVYNNRPTETYQELSFRFQGKKISRWYKSRGYGYTENKGEPGPVVKKPQRYAQFADGNEALGEFFSKNIRYPSEARAKNISGDVVLTFVVEENGYPSNIQVKDGLGAGCEQEAIRVLRLSRWKPAESEGKTVRSVVTLPVTFRLNTNLTNGISTEQKPY